MLFDGARSLVWALLLLAGSNTRDTHVSFSTGPYDCSLVNLTADLGKSAYSVVSPSVGPTPAPLQVPTIRIEAPTFSPSIHPPRNGRKGKTSPSSPLHSKSRANKGPRPSPVVPLLTTPPTYLIEAFPANTSLKHGPQAATPTRVPSRVPLRTAPPTLLHPSPTPQPPSPSSTSAVHQANVSHADVRGNGSPASGTWGVWGGGWLSNQWTGIHGVVFKLPLYRSHTTTSPVPLQAAPTTSSMANTTQGPTGSHVSSLTTRPVLPAHLDAVVSLTNGSRTSGGSVDSTRSSVTVTRTTTCGDDGSTITTTTTTTTTISTATHVLVLPPGNATCRPQPSREAMVNPSSGGLVGQRGGGAPVSADEASPANTTTGVHERQSHPTAAGSGAKSSASSGAWWSRTGGRVTALWARVTEGLHGLPLHSRHPANATHPLNDGDKGNMCASFNESTDMTSTSNGTYGGQGSPIVNGWGKATRVGNEWEDREGKDTPPTPSLVPPTSSSTPTARATARRDAVAEAGRQAGGELGASKGAWPSQDRRRASVSVSTAQQKDGEERGAEERQAGVIIEDPQADVVKGELKGGGIGDLTLSDATRYIYAVVGASVRIARGITGEVPKVSHREGLAHAAVSWYIDALQWGLLLASVLFYLYFEYVARSTRASRADAGWQHSDTLLLVDIGQQTSALPLTVTNQGAQLVFQTAPNASVAGAPPAAQLQGTPGPLSLMLAQGLVIQGPIHQPPQASQGQQPQMGPSADVVLLLQAQMYQEQKDAQASIKFLSRMTLHRHCLGSIGAGGQGTVFKYQDIGSGKLFALKHMSFLPPGPTTPLQAKLHALDTRAQAVREVGITSIMGTYDFATAVEDSAFTSSEGLILMEYADGVDAHKYITQILQGEIAAPTPLMVEGFLLELLRAVKVCRGHNIAHKDLKPANLIVKLEHAALIRPIVVDWGLACQNASHTPNNAEGTAAYLDADAFRCVGMTRAARDIFAVGLIGCQMAKRATEVWSAETLVLIAAAQQSAFVGTFEQTHGDLPALMEHELATRVLPVLADAMLTNELTPVAFVALREALHADPARREGLLDLSLEQLAAEGEMAFQQAVDEAMMQQAVQQMVQQQVEEALGPIQWLQHGHMLNQEQGHGQAVLPPPFHAAPVAALAGAEEMAVMEIDSSHGSSEDEGLSGEDGEGEEGARRYFDHHFYHG